MDLKGTSKIFKTRAVDWCRMVPKSRLKCALRITSSSTLEAFNAAALRKAIARLARLPPSHDKYRPTSLPLSHLQGKSSFSLDDDGIERWEKWSILSQHETTWGCWRCSENVQWAHSLGWTGILWAWWDVDWRHMTHRKEQKQQRVDLSLHFILILVWCPLLISCKTLCGRRINYGMK